MFLLEDDLASAMSHKLAIIEVQEFFKLISAA